MLPPLHDRLKPRAQRERRLSCPGPAAHADDADVRVEQQVKSDALLGRPAVQPEGLAVAPHQLQLLVRQHPGQRARAPGVQHQTRVTGQIAGRLAVEGATFVQFLYVVLGYVELGHSGPARIDGQLGTVLLCLKPNRRRLYPQRHVLADEDHAVALVGEGSRHRQDSRVVVPQPEAGREYLCVDVVELHAGGAAEVPHRDLGF